MSFREFTAQRKMLANGMATAAAELMEYMGTPAALAAIPNTEPPRYVVAGTLTDIVKLLPGAGAITEIAAPAVQAQAELTDERISEISRAYRNANGMLLMDISFARAIERELRAGSPDVRDHAQWRQIQSVPKDGSEVLLYLLAPYNRVAKARWFDVWKNWIEGEFPDPQDEYCGIGSCLPTHWMPLPEAPADSKEGGEHA